MINPYKESWEIAEAIANGEYDVVEGSDAIRDLVSRTAGQVAHRLASQAGGLSPSDDKRRQMATNDDVSQTST